jgi:alkaline phosphatase
MSKVATRIYTLLFCLAGSTSIAQTPSRQSIFAHNDYLKPDPFHGAYAEQVGYIEADVFLSHDKLLVAHTRAELINRHDIETLYLLPLGKKIRENRGFAYADSSLSLTLMIDLKTDGQATLKKLVELLKTYNDLIACKSLFITVSGNMPAPSTWSDYPSFIHFDGRPNIEYSGEQLARVRLVSSSFRDYSRWSGKGELPAPDREALERIVSLSHSLGKPVRFWATPDNANAWTRMSQIGVDVVNTDDVKAVLKWMGL